MKSATDQKLGTAELLYKHAQEMGLRPLWVTRKGLFVVSVAGQEYYINFARSPLNSHTSVSIAKNKYLTRLVLGRHGLPNIPFARPRTLMEAEAFLDAHGKIIAKPVTGSGAHDIHLITETAQLQSLRLADYILEKYIAGKELRFLMLNGATIAVHRSEYGTSVEKNRSLRRISYPSEAWSPTLMELSVQITHILGLQFAAVDYLIDETGHAHILEVNTAPGLKWFHSPTSGPVVDAARLFLEALFADQVMNGGLEEDIATLGPHVVAYS